MLVVGASAANPIRRIVNMMQDMQKKIEQEGERDKKLYDKFICYCQSGGVDMEKAIKEAEAKLPILLSQLQESKSQKEQLAADLKKDKDNEAEAETALGEATAIRTKEASAFSRESGETRTNLQAIIKAIEVLLRGGSFLQTDTAAVVRRLVVDMDMSNVDRDLMSSYLAGKEDGYAPAASQIIGILKAMRQSMEDDLSNMEKEETNAKSSYGELVGAKEKEIATNAKSVEEKTDRKGKVGVKIEELREDRDDTSASLTQDKKFLLDLEKNCKKKAEEMAVVQHTRAEELLAISETIKLLNDDDALELFKKTLPSTSLLQMTLRGKEVRQRAVRVLHGARHSRDTRLDLIALAIRGKKFSFDKVLTMVDEMVKLLRAEQASDDEKQAYCEKELEANEAASKELETDVSDLTKFIDETEEAIATFGEEIASLATGIKALDKSVADATANRKEENKEYKDTMASNTAAKEVLKMAKKRLTKFYNSQGASFVQAPMDAAPALVQVAARMRRSSDDGAPPPPAETFGAYTKKGGESAGVLGMVDMLIKDLDKEMTEMAVEEKDAQADYEQYITDSAEKRAADSKSIEEKESAKAAGEEALGKSKLEKKSKKKEAYSTAMLLRDLHLECDWLVSNYETRKKARAGEVDALKKAKEVLSGSDYALLQMAVSTKRRTFLHQRHLAA